METFTAGAGTTAKWSLASLSVIKQNWRYDAEYWHPVHVENERIIAEAGKTHEIKTVYDLVKQVTGSAFYPSFVGYYSDTGMPFIRVADLGDFFVEEEGMVRIDPRIIAQYRQVSTIREGDIVVAKGGSIGGVCIVQPGMGECAVCRDVIALKTDPKRIDSSYLVAFLRSQFEQLQLERYKSQQVQAHLTFPAVGNVKVVVPSRADQTAVSRLLQSAWVERNRATVLYAEAEALLLAELGLDDLPLSHQPTYTQSFSRAWTAGRLDAEYFQSKYQRTMEIMARSGKSIGDVVRLAKRRFEPRTGKPFQYIEIGDLDQTGHAESKTVLGEEAPSRAQWIVKTGDVITSTVRPIRRLSALIEPGQDGHVCSSGFVILKPTAIEPEVLLVYLRLPVVCEILDLQTSASMYPAISTTDLLNVPIPMPADKVRARVVELVQESRGSHQEARCLLEEAKRRVGEMVLGEE